MRAYLTCDDQLVLRDATCADAVAVWRSLHAIYLERRGPDRGAPAGDPVPATTHHDVIELVSAFVSRPCRTGTSSTKLRALRPGCVLRRS